MFYGWIPRKLSIAVVGKSEGHVVPYPGSSSGHEEVHRKDKKRVSTYDAPYDYSLIYQTFSTQG